MLKVEFGLHKDYSVPEQSVYLEDTVLHSPQSTYLTGTVWSHYTAASAGIWRAAHLFLCYGGPDKHCDVSKQSLAHLIVDVIAHACT